jgi:hypothetical protein
MKTYDFQQLYTKSPYSDLVARLVDLIRSAWLKYHPSMQSFKVIPRKASKKSLFSAGVLAAHMRAGDRFCTWTLGSICDAIRYLVTHTLVTFGDQVFRQKVGIPMGAHPAVHFTTSFLFSFKFGAARRCTELIRQPTPYLYNRLLSAADLPALLSMSEAELAPHRKDSLAPKIQAYARELVINCWSCCPVHPMTIPFHLPIH